MIELGRNLYSNVRVENVKKKVSEKVRAIVIGSCGSGKTKLFNNLCNTKNPTKFSKGSVTRDITYQDVVFMPQTFFRLYDTPGINSDQQALQCAQIIRATLTHLPVNLIIINSQLRNRFNQTLKEFKEQINILKGYEKYVVYLMSHFDTIPEKERPQILHGVGEEIRKYKNDFKLIIYSNTECDYEKMAGILYKFGQANERTPIKIVDKTFYKYFKISPPAISVQSQQVNNYITTIKEQADIFIDYVKQLKKGSTNNQQIISELKQYMKYHLKELQSQHYKQYKDVLKSQNQITDLFLFISQLIQSKLEEFQNQSELKYTKRFYDSQSQGMMDIRDLIKECPNCKTIWMKVTGCKNVICGTKLATKDYSSSKNILKYNFKIENGGITYTTEPTKVEIYNMITENQEKLQKIQRKIKLFGCRKRYYSQNYDEQKCKFIQERSLMPIAKVKRGTNQKEELEKISERINEVDKIQLSEDCSWRDWFLLQQQLLNVKEKIFMLKNYPQKQEQRFMLTSSQGCGHRFDWSLQPRSKIVQQNFKQLYQVSNFQQIKLNIDYLKKQYGSLYQEVNRRVKKNIQKMEKDKQ